MTRKSLSSRRRSSNCSRAASEASMVSRRWISRCPRSRPFLEPRADNGAWKLRSSQCPTCASASRDDFVGQYRPAPELLGHAPGLVVAAAAVPPPACDPPYTLDPPAVRTTPRLPFGLCPAAAHPPPVAPRPPSASPPAPVPRHRSAR